jgi:hypothetical protein
MGPSAGSFKRPLLGAEELSNTPWKLVADRLHANLAICQDAYRLRKLPPSILPEEGESFAQ